MHIRSSDCRSSISGPISLSQTSSHPGDIVKKHDPLETAFSRDSRSRDRVLKESVCLAIPAWNHCAPAGEPKSFQARVTSSYSSQNQRYLVKI